MLALGVASAGCGAEKQTTPPAANSARVALTLDYPGYAPWALIVYRDERDRSCHAIGTITREGPRVVDRIAVPLTEALTAGGHCIDAKDRDVSIQVRRGAAGGPRLVGGIVRRGVRRVNVAGRTVRPRRDGTFLLALPPSADSVGTTVGLEYHRGHRRKLPLGDVSS